MDQLQKVGAVLVAMLEGKKAMEEVEKTYGEVLEPHEALGMWFVHNKGNAKAKLHMVDSVCSHPHNIEKVIPVSVCGREIKLPTYRAGTTYYTSQEVEELLKLRPEDKNWYAVDRSVPWCYYYGDNSSRICKTCAANSGQELLLVEEEQRNIDRNLHFNGGY